MQNKNNFFMMESQMIIRRNNEHASSGICVPYGGLFSTNLIAAPADTVWTTALDRGFRDYAEKMSATSDGGYLIAGSSQQSADGGMSALIIKLSKDRTAVWGGISQMHHRALHAPIRRAQLHVNNTRPAFFSDNRATVFDARGRLFRNSPVNGPRQPAAGMYFIK